ncbi:hypothetical protein BU25DRAFT_466362 [Macroventuria anomochaeta]|uniref:Uncharacterized protein n=1 Tax=Macroventuria anomochaeta TaxID=301207 RepID=A0ACB6S3T1_9PLEO|nr:uncharacterized protein BU25DRAFT_466362 [Macroventuria anomochaeta]KAF2628618.1 hypothetical protein BU25DRAFT_466362 [Macroventuria anomochaeta]
MLLRRFAGGEELRNLLLPLECTADPLKQLRQTARLQLCPCMHPGQTANNEVTEKGKGDRSYFHEKTRQQSNGTPAIQDLAFAKAQPARAMVHWPGAVAFSAPSRGRLRRCCSDKPWYTPVVDEPWSKAGSLVFDSAAFISPLSNRTNIVQVTKQIHILVMSASNVDNSMKGKPSALSDTSSPPTMMTASTLTSIKLAHYFNPEYGAAFEVLESTPWSSGVLTAASPTSLEFTHFFNAKYSTAFNVLADFLKEEPDPYPALCLYDDYPRHWEWVASGELNKVAEQHELPVDFLSRPIPKHLVCKYLETLECVGGYTHPDGLYEQTVAAQCYAKNPPRDTDG